MRKWLLLSGATAVAVAIMVWAHQVFGVRSLWFAFFVVWVPMTWLGTVSRVATPRMPDRYHLLRGFEKDGQLYELLGVRLVKRLLRRGPLAVFNPDLRLPSEPNTANVTRLDQRMRDAEASHFILLVLMFGVVANAAVRGWWAVASWTLLLDILLNGYPVMLQRYNRALLSHRYETLEGGPPASFPGAGTRTHV